MNKTGVEFDFVVKDSLQALALYESIFEVERLEVTDLPVGQNEAVFTIYGTRFHLLDENPQFGLEAPAPGAPMSFWFNVMVPSIAHTFQKAINEGCTEVQPITELTDFGVSNAIFVDPFGYVWMLHQVHKEVSFEERMKLW
ncbi:MAG: VOC family protein [Limnochordia bacterium]|jgi:PhnB protein|nr:VOC family protein [Bacillota bacterium]